MRTLDEAHVAVDAAIEKYTDARATLTWLRRVMTTPDGSPKWGGGSGRAYKKQCRPSLCHRITWYTIKWYTLKTSRWRRWSSYR